MSLQLSTLPTNDGPVPCTTGQLLSLGSMWSCQLTGASLLHLEGVLLWEVGTLRASVGVSGVWVQSASIGRVLSSPGTWHFV